MMILGERGRGRPRYSRSGDRRYKNGAAFCLGVFRRLFSLFSWLEGVATGLWLE